GAGCPGRCRCAGHRSRRSGPAACRSRGSWFPPSVAGQDQLGAQFVALVGQARLVVDAVAALRQRQYVEVARIDHRAVVDLLELAAYGASQAGALEPVLLGGRPPVVAGAAVRQHAGEPRPARVPCARPRGEHRATPLPAQAVGAGGVGRTHAILRAGHVERVAADPGVPAAVDQLDDRIFHRRALVTRERRAYLGVREALRGVRLQYVDPPVLALRRAAADVEPPAALRDAHQRRAFHPLRAETGLVEHRDSGEALTGRRAGDDRLVDAVVAVADPVGDDVAAVAVQRRAGCPGPVARARARSRHGDDRLGRTRQGEINHWRTSSAGSPVYVIETDCTRRAALAGSACTLPRPLPGTGAREREHGGAVPGDRAVRERHAGCRRRSPDLLGALWQPRRPAGALPARRTRQRLLTRPAALLRPRRLHDRALRPARLRAQHAARQ